MQQIIIDWCAENGIPPEKVSPILEKRLAIMINAISTAKEIALFASRAPKSIIIGRNTRYGKYQKGRQSMWVMQLGMMAFLGAIRQATIISQPIPRYG